MPANEETLKKMDQAAMEAERELEPQFNKWSARDMVAWWAKWYGKAGHKRLGRLLVRINKQLRDSEG